MLTQVGKILNSLSIIHMLHVNTGTCSNILYMLMVWKSTSFSENLVRVILWVSKTFLRSTIALTFDPELGSRSQHTLYPKALVWLSWTDWASGRENKVWITFFYFGLWSKKYFRVMHTLYRAITPRYSGWSLTQIVLRRG